MKKSIKKKAIKIVLFAFLLFAAGTTNAQIGIGTATPVASAQLDVNSTNKGFLPPRLTWSQRNAITAPAPGLMIWCSNCGLSGEMQVFNGTSWTNGLGAATAPDKAILGTQEWMARNLDVTTYRNGDPIPQVTIQAQWDTTHTGAWCYYNNDPANGSIYGKLYNWYAVKDPRGLAPAGWQIPSNGEVAILAKYLGGVNAAGGKMKDTGIVYWNSPNIGANNASGFTALPGGLRYYQFYGIGTTGVWWTTTRDAGIYNYRGGNYSVSSSSAAMGTGESDPNGALSVRCIRATIQTVSIGFQEWTPMNLDVTTFRNGDPIPQVTDHTQWSNLTTGAWCYYNNDPANGAIYGKLYNWYAVNDPRGLAPAGYHVPSDAEWGTLIDFLGGEAIAGDKLKEKGTTHWKSPNAGATNISEFTALPGGYRDLDGTFKSINGVTSLWTSTERNTTNSWYRHINFYNGNVNHWDYRKWIGMSVRCIRD